MNTLIKNKFTLFAFSILALGFTVNCGGGNAEANKEKTNLEEKLPKRGFESKACRDYRALDRGTKLNFGGYCMTSRDRSSEAFAEIIDSEESLKSAMDRVGCIYEEGSEIEYKGQNRFDFSKEVLALVYSGGFPSSGYEILIFPPEEKDGGAVIRYSMTTTIELCRTGVANDAMDYSFAAIKLPKKEEGYYTLEEYDFPKCGGACFER